MCIYIYIYIYIYCRKKCILDLQRENGTAVSITTGYYLNTRDIPIRQHFQVTCDT